MRDRTWPYVPYNESDHIYFGCDAVVRDEWTYVRERRRRQDQHPGRSSDQDDKGAPPDLCGIALSGGGVRSASYCLGILQALSYAGWLRKLDYASMVSGGSYIGGSLAWLLHRKWEGTGKDEEIRFGLKRGDFPFGAYPMVGMSDPNAVRSGAAAVDTKADPPGPQAPGPASGTAGVRDCYKGRLLRYLRQHASYLMPGDGINALSLAAVVLRNSIFSIVAYGGLLVGLFVLLGPLLFCQGAACLLRPATVPGGLLREEANGALVLAAWAAFLSLLAALFYVFMVCFTRILNQADTCYSQRYAFERRAGQILLAVLVLLVVGAVPYAYDWFQSPAHESVSRSFRISGALDNQGEISIAGKIDASNPAGSGTKGTWWAGLRTVQQHLAVVVGALATLVGGISTLIGYLRGGKGGKIPTGLLVAAGSVSLIFGLLVLAYASASAIVLHRSGDPTAATGALWSAVTYAEVVREQDGSGGVRFSIVFLLFLCLLRFPDLNYMSIHRYYRDRLMETFTPDLPDALDVNGPVPGGRKSADSATLKEMAPTTEGLELGPYPIINTNVVLVSSRIPKFRARGGDNFILAPRHCGSNATGWCATGGEGSPFAEFTLPTAIATSGAAIDPNTGGGGEGVTKSPLLSFLMGFFNVRLGYWVENPTPPDKRMERIRTYLEGSRPATRAGSGKPLAAAARALGARWTRLTNALTLARHRVLSGPLVCDWGGPNVLYPGLSELYLRRNLDENSRLVQLSDGGHFENLGLYELVRRRLRLIIVCDGAAHPSFGFDDLGNAIEKVRADFGALIDIDCEDLKALTPIRSGAAGSEKDSGYAKRGYLRVGITYNDRTEGTLIYLTSTFFDQLSADLYAYRKSHGEFPNQSTADQFFDEKQFEAYRELGYQTAYQMMSDTDLMRDPNVRNTVGIPDVKCSRSSTRRHTLVRNHSG